MVRLFYRTSDCAWSTDGRAWYPSPELALTARRGSLVVYERARRSFTVTVDEEQWYLYEFQSLIGRLVTRYRAWNVECFPDKFQSLIGRLVTSMTRARRR